MRFYDNIFMCFFFGRGGIGLTEAKRNNNDKCTSAVDAHRFWKKQQITCYLGHDKVHFHYHEDSGYIICIKDLDDYRF